jgi:hypothetical protein
MISFFTEKHAKQIGQWIPIGYALMTLLGFINYYTIYKAYGIEVVNYLTGGEILLASFPLVVPFLLIIAYAACIFITLFVLEALQISWSKTKQSDSIENEKKPIIKKPEDKIELHQRIVGSVERRFNDLGESSWRKCSTYLKLIKTIISFIWLFSFWAWATLIPLGILYLSIAKHTFFLSANLIIALAFFWASWFNRISPKLINRFSEIRMDVYVRFAIHTPLNRMHLDEKQHEPK